VKVSWHAMDLFHFALARHFLSTVSENYINYNKQGRGEKE
jgi:hypothetical protein